MQHFMYGWQYKSPKIEKPGILLGFLLQRQFLFSIWPLPLFPAPQHGLVA
jgi:hypothetical protein